MLTVQCEDRLRTDEYLAPHGDNAKEFALMVKPASAGRRDPRGNGRQLLT
jgi:hypothetical protein